jgi:hypothetical protein
VCRNAITSRVSRSIVVTNLLRTHDIGTKIVIIIIITMKSSVYRDNNNCHYVILRNAGFAITLHYHPAARITIIATGWLPMICITTLQQLFSQHSFNVNQDLFLLDTHFLLLSWHHRESGEQLCAVLVVKAHGHIVRREGQG